MHFGGQGAHDFPVWGLFCFPFPFLPVLVFISAAFPTPAAVEAREDRSSPRFARAPASATRSASPLPRGHLCGQCPRAARPRASHQHLQIQRHRTQAFPASHHPVTQAGPHFRPEPLARDRPGLRSRTQQVWGPGLLIWAAPAEGCVTSPGLLPLWKLPGTATATP